METLLFNSNSRRKVNLVIATTFFSIVAIISFALHFSPVDLLENLADFSRHHYFLMGFICLSIALISLKFYAQQAKPTLRKRITPSNRRMLRRLKRRNIRQRLFSIEGKSHSFSEQKSAEIQKTAISKIRFTKQEVLHSEEEKAERKISLENALKLGNMYKQKVTIFFDDNGALKHTNTTIWHVDDKTVCLKGEAFIPVNKIYKILF